MAVCGFRPNASRVRLQSVTQRWTRGAIKWNRVGTSLSRARSLRRVAACLRVHPRSCDRRPSRQQRLGWRKSRSQSTSHGPARSLDVTVSDDGGGMSENALGGRDASRQYQPSRGPACLRPGQIRPRAQDRVLLSGARTHGRLEDCQVPSAATIRRWDLDTVAASGEWRLLRTAPAGVAVLEPTHHRRDDRDWSKLDRLVGDVEADDAKAHKRFLDVTARVQRHLEATFHRFLSGRGASMDLSQRPRDRSLGSVHGPSPRHPTA